MATIRIAEPAHPAWAGDASTSSAAGVGGVFPMRRLPKATSFDRRSWKSAMIEDADEDEDSGLRQNADYKAKQIFSGRLLLWLAYQSIGVIYGDIGTSPLYVFSSTFSSPPAYDDLVGALSLIIWSLIMMVTVKYILIILRADNDGEGGTFSTYSLLSRFMNITSRDPREASLVRMERHLSNNLGTGGKTLRSGFERSKFAKILLKVMGVLAVTMVLADGVLTPAQSVLGAVQGLEVAVPNISHSTVVGTTCGILILLFVIQPLGIEKITVAFSPIVIIWLAFNAAFGIYNLALFDHSVLKAFGPNYAFEYLIRNKTEGWKSLGGILLAFTGVEALFADLGAFSMRAVQLSWLAYTFPCLLLAYIGQAAYISIHPDAYSNPFFNSCPPHMVIPSLVVAVLAAIVASQAIITASFQLLSQITKLSYFPQIKITHTSKIFHGQLYVPLANWLLMIGTVLIAGIFNNTTSLGNAYGVCVMFVTFFDTCMVTLTAIFVWRYSPFVVFIPWLIIACLDCSFLSSALVKVPQGAWFTITLAAILACILIEWRFGKEQQWKAEAEDRFPTSHFVHKTNDGALQLTERYGGMELSTIKGFGIFFDKAGETTPIVFSQFISKLVAAPEVMVFFHLRPLERPSVPPEERYSVSRLAIPHCYRLVVRHGYMDRIVTPELGSLVFQQIRQHLFQRAVSPSPSTTKLDTAASTRPVGMAPARSPAGIPLAVLPANDSTSTVSRTKPTDADISATSSSQPASATTNKGKDRATTNPNPIPTTTTSTYPPSEPNSESYGTLSTDLQKLEQAYNHQVLYIIGKEALRVKAGTGIVRKVLLEAFLWIRDNTRTKIANLKVPIERVVEVGFVKDM